MTASEPFVHLATPEEWDRARRAGQVAPPSLDMVGFVHGATAGQLPVVLARHFGAVDELVAVSLDATRLTAPLRWEESHPGEWYPHVYGPISLDAVVGVERWRRGPTGGWAPVGPEPPDQLPTRRNSRTSANSTGAG